MIPRSDIDRVLDANPLLPLAQQYIRLRRMGRQWFGLCPAHNERSPSFAVDPDKGLYHCHGCHVGGSAIDLVILLEHVSFPSAVRLLADRGGVTLSDAENDNKNSYVAMLAAEASWFWTHARRLYGERESAMVSCRNYSPDDEEEFWALLPIRRRCARSAARWHRIIAKLDATAPDRLLARYVGIRQRKPAIVREYRQCVEEERAWAMDWQAFVARLRSE